MHVNKITVNESDIKYVEKILLEEGQVFDETRRNYIRDFSTLDVMAVPGSGKTTLLLAKLLILEKHLPLKDNQSVLVISHTNIAVEEIRDKIKLYCPKLFSYPNFIGTIQSFVNKYLALPYYESVCKKKIITIDDENYNRKIEDYYNNLENYRLKKWLEKQHNPIELLKKIRFNENSNLVNYINGSEDDFILKNKTTNSYKGLKSMKNYLLKSGILHYDDAYYLASRYIQQMPMLINILQKKFSFIFIDEMQDMDIHQYNLLEKLFAIDASAQICFQRLGDNNQAIYSNIVHSENIWQNRDTIHKIIGSNRLSKLNAKLASRFALDNIQIEGLNLEYKEHKPVLVIYKKSKAECCTIQAFSKYLNELFKDESAIKGRVNFKVVSWRKFHEDKEKITLSSYCPNYKLTKSNKKLVSLDKTTSSYFEVVQILQNYLVNILKEVNIELGVHNLNGPKLLEFIKITDLEEYKKLRLQLYYWCNLLLDNKTQEFIEKLNNYLPCFAKLFNIRADFELKDIRELNFIKDTSEEIQEVYCDKCDVLGISPNICSAHSVKGETHDATLFLETFYNSNYESDILYEVLSGKKVFDLLESNMNEIESLQDKINELKKSGKTRGIKSKKDNIRMILSRISRIKQYSKLVYVALTRAKGVIGYGINEEKYNAYLDGNLNKDEWTIIKVE